MFAIQLLLQNLDQYWNKTIVYEYDDKVGKVTRSGSNVYENNPFLEGGNVFVGNGDYRFKFVPSLDYDPEEGCRFRCSNCKDEDPESITLEEADEQGLYLNDDERFEAAYDFERYGFCDECRLKDFKRILYKLLVKYAPWDDETYDDHRCIFKCNRKVVEPHKKRNPSDPKTLQCAEHLGSWYANKTYPEVLQEYLQKKRKTASKRYIKITKFLECPVPQVINVLVDSQGRVVPAKLKKVC